MKKYTLLILSLLLTFSFVGCDTKKYELYMSFISDSVNDEYSVDSEIDYWTGMYFEKENMEDKTCLVFGDSYTGSYSKSIVDKMNSYTTDIYVGNDNIEFGLRSDTEELVYINLMNSDFFDTQPYLPEIDNPNDTAISLSTEIASHYVDDIEDYTQISDEPVTRYKERDGQTYQITYYIVTLLEETGFICQDGQRPRVIEQIGIG